jgi:hypothetical protein
VGVVLVKQVLDSLPDVHLFIVRGNDNADRRRVIRRGDRALEEVPPNQDEQGEQNVGVYDEADAGPENYKGNHCTILM